VSDDPCFIVVSYSLLQFFKENKTVLITLHGLLQHLKKAKLH